jgi:hypothetical protein
MPLGLGAQGNGGRPMNRTISSAFTNFGGPVLLGFGVAGLFGVLAAMFWMMMKLIPKDGSGSLPLLAIGGVVVLILLLTAVAMIFSILKLTNDSQAMGLPEGSIRAVIALSLIVLFAILSVFLYSGVSTGSRIANDMLPETQRMQFMREHTAQDVQSVLLKDKDGNPLKSADGKENLYNVSYRIANPTSDDFAKQLLVLLGTLMTAITSFYLGAGTATSAAKVGEATKEPPTISDIKPTSHSIANDGPVIHLQIMGANLNLITHLKIVRTGAEPVIATNVHSSPTSVTCDIPVSALTTPPGSPWDVVADDGGSKSVTKQAALTIAA